MAIRKDIKTSAKKLAKEVNKPWAIIFNIFVLYTLGILIAALFV